MEGSPPSKGSTKGSLRSSGKGNRPPPVDKPWDGEEDAEVAAKVRGSLEVCAGFWNEEACADIEAEIEGIAVQARKGKYRAKTVDRTPLRSKYFFGYGYTYGSQISKKGGEQILPPELIDPVPDFIYDKLILPLEEKGLVPEGWLNSAVVNDYRPGGMIVSHIDPPQLFARPIFISSFYAEGSLVFGSRFSFPNKGGPPQTTPPKCKCTMPRGSLTIMKGYSADGITHGIRPQDLDGRRVSIVLRHVFANAPRSWERPEPVEVPLSTSWTADGDNADAPAAEETEQSMPEEKIRPARVNSEPIEVDDFGRRVARSQVLEEETSNVTGDQQNEGQSLHAGRSAEASKKKSNNCSMSEKQKAALVRLQQRHPSKNGRSRSPRR
mmetsp:Transcript_10484/g.17360  ORF Transcript_10484/g.17360 Transcript_10484/m.17360 type:complete len:381 (-) Transcript_10484:93-1235(-)